MSYRMTACPTNLSTDYATLFTARTMRSFTNCGTSSETSGLLYKSRVLQEKGFWAKDSKLVAEESQWTKCVVKHELLPKKEPKSARYKHLARDLVAKRLNLEGEAYEKL